MKRVFVLMLVAIAVFSCQKREVDPATVEQEVVFTGIDTSTDGQKSTNTGCDNPIANYASIVINSKTYRPAVFYIGGVAYTQSIKFTAGNYTLGEFMLMNDNNTPGLMSDDMVVKAAPLVNSTFATFVNQAMPLNFSIEPFKKTEIPVQVLCFSEADYEYFGFNWFAMTEIVVREQVFFGDFCVNFPDDYAGSIYANQANGPQIDMPAIFRVDVYRNGAFLISFNNEEWFGEGQPLKVKYPDHMGTADHFDFELYVLVKACGGFEYVHFKTWSVDDDEVIAAGSDDVIDFALGDCSTGADFTMPPYLVLPTTAKAEVKTGGASGSLGTFFDYKLKQIPDGYKLFSDEWPGWSAHHQMYIENGDQQTDVYSSLCSNLPDPISHTAMNWNAVNWLMNNLDLYQGYTWDEIQCAIWLINDPGWDGSAHGLALSGLAQVMYDDAIIGGVGYVPPPSGVAAVIFVHNNDNAVNLLFVEVDP